MKEQKIKIPPQGKFEPKKVCCDQNAINYGWSEFTESFPPDPCSAYNYWHQYANQNEYGHWQMEDMVIPDLTHWFSTAGAEFMNQGGKVDFFLMQGPNSIDTVIECDPSVCCGGGQDIKKLKKPLKEINLASIGKQVMGRMKKTIQKRFPMLENETITSNYTEFKRWAIEYGTTKLFKEEKFKAPSDIEYTLEEATNMGAGIMFFVLTEIWKMWSEEDIEDTNEFGKELYFTMKKDDFFFDKEAMGAEIAIDRQDADYLKQNYGVEMNEKKIGFNRGPEYSEETEDLLNDFAKSTEMINKVLQTKVIDNDDPKVQEILNILDDNLDSEFIGDLETVYELVQGLPDKEKDKPKVGFRSNLQEILQIRAGIIK